MIRILGIDPGLTRCGYGVIDRDQQINTYVSVGLIQTAAADAQPARLLQIFNELTEVFEKFAPNIVAVERPFLTKGNPNTGFGTAQVAGIAMILAEKSGLPIYLYTPPEVKAAVSGNGGADKLQVQTMVGKLLVGNIPNKLAADAYDALAIALTASMKPQTAQKDVMSTSLDVGEIRNTIKISKTASTPAQKLWTQAVKNTRSSKQREM